MATSTFSKFLSAAQRHAGLITDLCAETDLISRSKLLNYLARYSISPSDKDALIKDLCRTSILNEESDYLYGVNPVVVNLVNFYERRGRLTSASFLRDQILKISSLTDKFQLLLFDEKISIERTADTVDEIYLLVREVRESGFEHYIACMRAFGDMKRTGENQSVAERIKSLERVQRRYISPLRELIDPGSEPVRKLQVLKQRMKDLGKQTALLADSMELDRKRKRLNFDLEYIDHVLLRYFEMLSDTARSTLKTLIEEKNIKDALAFCLGNIDSVWEHLEKDTIFASGSQFSQAPSLDRLGFYFSDVIHGKLLPDPHPLHARPAIKLAADDLLIQDEKILALMEKERVIESWPDFVMDTFHKFSFLEKLKALSHPLLVPERLFSVKKSKNHRTFSDKEISFTLYDFGIIWESEFDRRKNSER
jgi:hypothetical protein